MALKPAGTNLREFYGVLKIAVAYGFALGAAETLLFLAGHGGQVPAGSRALVYGATLASDLAAVAALTIALYGTALFVGKLIPAAKRRSAALAEIGLVSVVWATYAALTVRSQLFHGLRFTHPYKLGVFAACGLGALAAAVGWRALRGKIAKKPVLIAAAFVYVTASAVFFVLPEIRGATPPKAVGPDVIFISLDTLRADHLGCYGYPRNTSPYVDAFAGETVFYENALCVQPTTNPSHVSMFTGLYPAEHGVVSNFIPFRSDAPTLAELLAAYGYETIGVTGGFPLDRRLSGLGRGFRYYNDYINRWSYFRHAVLYRSAAAVNKTLFGTLRPAPAVTAAALRLLGRRRDRPLFLFAHYFDPHTPYRYRGAAERFYDGVPPVDFVGEQVELRHRWRKYKSGNPRPAYTAAIEALYDDEIHFMDRALGNLLDGLRRRGDYDRTLVVVVSDHGESFGEHRAKLHGGTVYDSETRVCLMIKTAAPLRPRYVRTQVETLNLAYTILAAAGAPAEAYRGRRLDLLTVRDDPAAAPPPWGFSQTNVKATLSPGAEVSRKYCLRTSSLKLIFDVDDQRYECYDLVTDPAETRDLGARVDDPAYELYRGKLADHIKKTVVETSGHTGGDLAEALRSLGYTN